jgi:hypothetical protein
MCSLRVIYFILHFSDTKNSYNLFYERFIPGVVKLSPVTKFRGDWAIDGGFTKAIPYKFENSKKLFINVLPEFFYLNIPPNCTIINIHKEFDLTFPNDYWNWNSEFCDNMYLKGYVAGEKLKD